MIVRGMNSVRFLRSTVRSRSSTARKAAVGVALRTASTSGLGSDARGAVTVAVIRAGPFP